MYEQLITSNCATVPSSNNKLIHHISSFLNVFTKILALKICLFYIAFVIILTVRWVSILLSLGGIHSEPQPPHHTKQTFNKTSKNKNEYRLPLIYF